MRFHRFFFAFRTLETPFVSFLEADLRRVTARNSLITAPHPCFHSFHLKRSRKALSKHVDCEAIQAALPRSPPIYPFALPVVDLFDDSDTVVTSRRIYTLFLAPTADFSCLGFLLRLSFAEGPQIPHFPSLLPAQEAFSGHSRFF